LKPSTTRITHTLDVAEGTPGFDFLGLQIRPYPVGKTTSGKDGRGRVHGFTTRLTPSPTAMQRQVEALRKTRDRQRHAAPEALIKARNPPIIGWSASYAHVVSARVFQRLDHTGSAMRWGWAVSRHPKKATQWSARTYWRVDDGQGWRFQPSHSPRPLARHDHTPHQRSVTVQGTRSPYDGDWWYWSRRRGRHPHGPPRIARLLKQQQGRCRACGLYCMDGDTIDVDHLLPTKPGGGDVRGHLQLVHRHGHETKTARETGCQGTHDTRHVVEEPDERQRSCPVV